MAAKDLVGDALVSACSHGVMGRNAFACCGCCPQCFGVLLGALWLFR